MEHSKCLPPVVRRSRGGFTLVELVIALMIMSILASMIIIVSRGVEADARVSKTRSTVTKIADVLAAKYEHLFTSPIMITIPERAQTKVIVNGMSEAVTLLPSREAATARLIALRDRIRMILPIRHEDLPIEPFPAAAPFDHFCPPSMVQLRVLDPQGPFPTLMNFEELGGVTEQEIQQLTNAIPAESITVANLLNGRFVNSIVGKNASPLNEYWWTNNENAELLYAIVESSTVDGGNALELFRSSEIGDTDRDNCPEFLDAWGTPIGFIRWPSGALIVDSSLSNDPFNSGDPFDPLKADYGYEAGADYFPGKPLLPLVVSAGPNGLFGVNGIEARKPEFGSPEPWTDKVLFSARENLPSRFSLAGEVAPPVGPSLDYPQDSVST